MLHQLRDACCSAFMQFRSKALINFIDQRNVLRCYRLRPAMITKPASDAFAPPNGFVWFLRQSFQANQSP